MILTVFNWTCTCCGHGKSYDPQHETSPETCPACGEGSGYFYNTISEQANGNELSVSEGVPHPRSRNGVISDE